MSFHAVPDLTPRTKEKLIQQQKLTKLHSDPILPDDIDEYGNLPSLRCGWKKCGKTFHSKEALLRHVKDCCPHPFVARFHLNCKNVLENDPDLTLQRFIDKVTDCYPKKDADHIEHDELLNYYNTFQPLFKKHQFFKDTTKMSLAQKELTEILFNYRIESQNRLIQQNIIPQQFPQ